MTSPNSEWQPVFKRLSEWMLRAGRPANGRAIDLPTSLSVMRAIQTSVALHDMGQSILRMTPDGLGGITIEVDELRKYRALGDGSLTRLDTDRDTQVTHHSGIGRPLT